MKYVRRTWGAGCVAASVLMFLIQSAGTAIAQSCNSLGGAPFCGGQRAHTTVGNTVVFPHGPPGHRVGNFIVLEVDGKPRLVGGLPPAAGKGPPEGARPLGSLIDLNKGRDFGAFVFPSGAAGTTLRIKEIAPSGA